jgi:hypothetical protein
MKSKTAIETAVTKNDVEARSMASSSLREATLENVRAEFAES